jgi:hypothetical protein
MLWALAVRHKLMCLTPALYCSSCQLITGLCNAHTLSHAMWGPCAHCCCLLLPFACPPDMCTLQRTCSSTSTQASVPQRRQPPPKPPQPPPPLQPLGPQPPQPPAPAAPPTQATAQAPRRHKWQHSLSHSTGGVARADAQPWLLLLLWLMLLLAMQQQTRTWKTQKMQRQPHQRHTGPQVLHMAPDQAQAGAQMALPHPHPHTVPAPALLAARRPQHLGAKGAPGTHQQQQQQLQLQLLQPVLTPPWQPSAHSLALLPPHGLLQPVLVLQPGLVLKPLLLLLLLLPWVTSSSRSCSWSSGCTGSSC